MSGQSTNQTDKADSAVSQKRRREIAARNRRVGNVFWDGQAVCNDCGAEARPIDFLANLSCGRCGSADYDTPRWSEVKGS